MTEKGVSCFVPAINHKTKPKAKNKYHYRLNIIGGRWITRHSFSQLCLAVLDRELLGRLSRMLSRALGRVLPRHCFFAGRASRVLLMHTRGVVDS